MHSYQPWLDSPNQKSERLPFAWANVWHWHNFWYLSLAAIFALAIVVFIITCVVEPRKGNHSSGKKHATFKEEAWMVAITLALLVISAVASGSFVYAAGTPEAPSRSVSFVQYVEHETGAADLSCPRLDSLGAQDAPNGGWYQCKTGKDTEPLLLYVDRQAHAFSLQDHASNPNRHVNPVSLESYQPIEETKTYSPSGWHIALFALAVIVFVGSIIALHSRDADTALIAMLLGAFSGLSAIMLGIGLLSPTSHQYDAIPLTGVIEQESHVTNLQCAGLDGMPSVEQYKKTGEQPWPATSDTMFSCTWQADDEQVEGKLKLIPKQAYEGTSLVHESGSIYADGLHEAQLLTMDNTIWTPDAKETS